MSGINPEVVAKIAQQHAAREAVRVAQQGQGRPIVSSEFGDYTVVATGKTLTWSKNWRTFPDFLGDYVKVTLGSDWGNAEIAKPLADRHPILQWYEAFCSFQKLGDKNEAGIYSSQMTGASSCYLGLAYNLYLIKHNVELQERLVSRLKDPLQFQGAYYELIVANCLIRAGFELELEDETDLNAKHCEFSAKSSVTNKRYWIEAKMRSVPDVLGKSNLDGSKTKDPTSRLTKHLSDALKKPAPDERIIFIDLNAEPTVGSETPTWLDMAVRRLEAREKDLRKGQEAYVFVTNMAFHHALDSQSTIREALAFGLGMPDFSKPGPVALPDWYKRKQRHIDAHSIFESCRSYPQIPSTFDGSPPSESFENSKRLLVGETYFFEDAGEDGVLGTVTSVAVVEEEKRAYVAVIDLNRNQSKILTNELSDRELEDYQTFGDAYFGESKNRGHKSNDIFELYEWMVEIYSNTDRKKLLEMAKSHPDYEALTKLRKEDLVLRICEGWAISIFSKSN